MADPPTLIGRSDARTAVAAELRSGGSVAVVGEAGIGKTTLVRGAAALARLQLHEGGGFATLAWLPYLALRRAVAIGEAADPARVVATVRRAVGRGVLFIDDLQWVDAATRAVLAELDGIPRVVAVREGVPGADRTIGELEDIGFRVVRLGRLDERSTVALANRLRPGLPDVDRRRLAATSKGNPLALEELVAHGAIPSWLARALHGPDALTSASHVRPGAVDGRDLAGPRGHATPARWTEGEAGAEAAVGITGDIAQGRLADAAAASRDLLATSLEPLARQRLLASRGVALALLGQIDAAEHTLHEAGAVAVAGGGPDGDVLCAWAEVALWGGRPARAIEKAEAALQAATSEAVRARATLTGAWAALDLGRLPTAVMGDPTSRRPAAAQRELDGLLALAAEAPERAATLFDAAARGWRGRDVPRELVCRWAAAEARRRAGDAGAPAALRRVLEATLAIGFEALAARVRRSLRLAGDRSAAPRLARTLGDPLTPREREVLRMVEGGRTNPEIARRMGLGRPTVARMLSNAMLKLGAQSRAHAIVLAAASGPRLLPVDAASEWRN